MNSNAAAIKRRAKPDVSLPLPGQSNSTSTQGLTLPQVIAVIDKRLITLETSLKDGNNNVNAVNTSIPSEELDNIKEILDEYNNRFDMLAEEIGNIKDMLLKLQTYTMDVNKALYDERIHVLSDFGTSKKETSFLQEVDVSSVELRNELSNSASM